MPKIIEVNQRKFQTFITSEEIASKVEKLAHKISLHYEEMPLLIAVLNGSFVFAADLSRALTRNHQIEFLKYSSYEGTQSTGQVNEMIGLDIEMIKGMEILIVEDIVDTGLTLEKLSKDLYAKGAKNINIVTAFFKPDAFKGKSLPEFIGFSIENKFVLGYGMDFNGLGRNLKDLFVLVEEN